MRNNSIFSAILFTAFFIGLHIVFASEDTATEPANSAPPNNGTTGEPAVSNAIVDKEKIEIAKLKWELLRKAEGLIDTKWSRKYALEKWEETKKTKGNLEGMFEKIYGLKFDTKDKPEGDAGKRPLLILYR